MGIRKRSTDSLDKENWEMIFNSLVKILRQKEEELQSQVKIFEDRITKTHEAWVSDVQNYEGKLSLIKEEIKTMEMMRLVEIAKCNLMLGSKERDHFFCKEQLEHTQDELHAFRAWFDFFTPNKNKETSDSGDADDCKSLEDKIRKLKLEFEKLSLKKGCEVSTLLQESGFAWSQFKRIESGFTGKLMRKDEEIKQANKNIYQVLYLFRSSFNHLIMRKIRSFQD